MDIYEKLGVRKFINARGTQTRFGGAIMLPAVVDAMVAASKSSVYLAELQDVIGARIAAMTQNEAAIVTCGAAAGIVLAVSACMTGDDRNKMASVPDTRGMKNEVIVQRHMRFDEDCVLKQAGARIIEITGAGSLGEVELAAAIGPGTAAIFTTPWTGSNTIPLHSVVRLARQRNIPVIVDAAAELPPSENLWKFTKEAGADLAIFSGGKGLRGPQSSGLVVGTRQIIEAMKMQASPHCYIGRPMKVGKEEMVGLYMAVECLLASPDQERNDLFAKRMLHIETHLRPFRFLEFKHEGSKLIITWDEAACATTAEEVAVRMRYGKPGIECVGWNGLRLNMEPLQVGEEEIVASRLSEIMRLMKEQG
ncbi:MAG TPA: aminotransferase class V-fold PLP-dependent enzyme [Candidatus Saccharimonadales bacterium]|nr:aminotransferase class V-fold PLP-dependent enzyme [Candidatus Saccharimonadales bacterium]